MSSISSSAASPAASNTLVGNSIEDLDLDVFLDLMLAELQNQDPLNPMENDEMLNTISQIREISANDKLSETLESVLLGQNVTTATGLIGTEVEGLTDAGRRVIGDVRQVTINDGQPRLELAVETTASADDLQGDIEEGDYSYEVIWEVDGEKFGVQVPVSTDDFGDDFVGSIRLENLPELDSNVKRNVYRSDGTGDPLLVGVLPVGSTTSFTDAKATSDIGPGTLTGQRTVLRYADSVEVSLNNITNVQTLK